MLTTQIANTDALVCCLKCGLIRTDAAVPCSCGATESRPLKVVH